MFDKIRKLGKVMMTDPALGAIHHHHPRISPIRRWMLGDKLRRQLILEIACLHRSSNATTFSKRKVVLATPRQGHDGIGGAIRLVIGIEGEVPPGSVLFLKLENNVSDQLL